MRATISLLVPSLLLGFLAFDHQAMASDVSLWTSSSQNLLSVKPHNKKKTEPPTSPYRGSGRREIPTL
ncbi:MAG: hypothetical protein DSM106950_14885 [Stigonema ocellatum SAG 48.90 = DSM 106950]|nr:hypothetical protein [Stigonema ocellatum SAG 48.90 = DSM 106950]